MIMFKTKHTLTTKQTTKQNAIKDEKTQKKKQRKCMYVVYHKKHTKSNIRIQKHIERKKSESCI